MKVIVRRTLSIVMCVAGLCLLLGQAFSGTRKQSKPERNWIFTPAAPFELDFGRGSGMVGLDTVAISEDGNAVLHRLGEHRQWVWATLRLSREQMRSIANMITRRGLGSLQNEYTPSFRVHDGTQWVLLIRQGDRRKSSYFDNSFPSAIRSFAADLDGMLRAAGSERLHWQPIENGPREHEKLLWNSIR